MRFGILGPLAVWTSAGAPVRIPEVKVRALLVNLLLSADQVVSAERLIDDLWSEHQPANPAGALQTRVSQLRRALAEAEPGGRELLVRRAPGYVLHADAETLDSLHFQGLLRQARAVPDPRARAAVLADALALWRGSALLEFADEPYARAAVTQLDEQWLTAVEEQAEARLELAEHSTLADELADVVARHPLRERLRACYLRALYRAGRQSEALDSYQSLRVRLADELGVDPSPELANLHQAILRQDPALSATSTTAAAAPRTNLPAAVSDLIGRDGAVAEVRSLLDTARLVTLTGTGGVGKTRLALATAQQLTDAYADGVWLVELGGATVGERVGTGPAGEVTRGPVDVAEVLASVLEIRDDAGPARSLRERLAEALRSRHLLLLLDNCEHVVSQVAQLSAQLLRAAPQLRILATSQQPIGIGGERLWPVPPLTLPAPAGGRLALAPAAAAESSAVRLFVARAAAALPGFTLAAENADWVTAICRRLDGIPLALELAATRLRVLGGRELADRLNDRFRLLSAGQRDAPPRQQTLRAVLDWSWELLTGPEQLVLRRLSVAAEGCTLAAAEAICGGADLPAETVLDLLGRLVDRSLVVASVGADGSRYSLLESVAAYSAERLREAGEFNAVSAQHDGYYAELAEAADPQLRGPAQREWLGRLDAESTRLRRAFESALYRGDQDLARRLALAQAWYWALRGRLSEGRRAMSRVGTAEQWCAATLWQAGYSLRLGETPGALPGAQAPPPREPAELAAVLRAQWFVGLAQLGLGELAAGEKQVEETLSLFRLLGDSWGTAAAVGTRARQALLRGDLGRVREYGEESLALFTALGDRWGQLQARYALGSLAEITGDYAYAARLHRDSLRTAEELGLWTDVADKLAELGRISLLTGELSRAEQLHQRASALAREHGYLVGAEFAELGLALGARCQGELDIAERYLRTWLDWDRQMNAAVGLALIFAELGFIAELRGDADAARSLHLEGLEAARGTADPRAIALAAEGLAGAAVLADEPVVAAQLLGAAAATREAVGAPLPAAERGDVDRISSKARGALGEPQFAAEYQRGRGLDLRQSAALEQTWR